MSSWDVIIWKDENAVDFVPTSWANETYDCYKYPLSNSETKIRRLIYECKDLSENFKWCDAKLKKRSITNLEKAKRLCERSQFTSNLDSSSDASTNLITGEKRKRRKTRRLIEETNPASDDDDDECQLVSGEEQEPMSDDQEDTGSEENSPEQFQVPVLRREKRVKNYMTPYNENLKDTQEKRKTGDCYEVTPIKHRLLPMNFSTPSKSTYIQNKTSEFSKNKSYDELTPNRFSSACSVLTNHTESNFSKEFVASVLKNQASIQFELKEIKKKLERLENNNLRLHSNQEIEESVFNKLPCTTMHDLEEIELYITDNNKLNELANILYLVGGDNVHKTIYSILKKLLSNEVALNFSGQGKKLKRPFCALNLHKAVIDAVRKRHNTATDEDIKKNIGLYLAQTKGRINGTPQGR